jgi:hypothetical protein
LVGWLDRGPLHSSQFTQSNSSSSFLVLCFVCFAIADPHFTTFAFFSLAAVIEPSHGQQTMCCCYTTRAYTIQHNHFLMYFDLCNQGERRRVWSSRKYLNTSCRPSIGNKCDNFGKPNSPSRLMPTAMHFLSRQYWQRFRFTLWIMHCWFLVHGLYWIFC